MMKLLVTGGAGFIGSNFIYYQLAKHPQDQILCLDALTYAGNLVTLDQARDNGHFKFIKGNITDAGCVERVFCLEKPDVVVNFAAETHVDRSILRPDVFLQSNIMGTHVLMEACRKHGIMRYHQISTDEVYGDLPIHRTDLFFREDTPIHASSPYSASKASADLLALAYYRTYNLPISITRCSNNYGPFQHPEKLIPLMILRASQNQRLPIYGRGENVRDWLYVEDHCEAVDLVLRHGKPGSVYNVGGHNERANLQVAQAVLDALGKPKSLIEFVPDRPGHDRRYAIDPSRIKKDLGWKPKFSFETGLGHTIRWYLENADWLAACQAENRALKR